MISFCQAKKNKTRRKAEKTGECRCFCRKTNDLPRRCSALEVPFVAFVFRPRQLFDVRPLFGGERVRFQYDVQSFFKSFVKRLFRFLDRHRAARQLIDRDRLLFKNSRCRRSFTRSFGYLNKLNSKSSSKSSKIEPCCKTDAFLPRLRAAGDFPPLNDKFVP